MKHNLYLHNKRVFHYPPYSLNGSLCLYSSHKLRCKLYERSITKSYSYSYFVSVELVSQDSPNDKAIVIDGIFFKILDNNIMSVLSLYEKIQNLVSLSSSYGIKRIWNWRILKINHVLKLGQDKAEVVLKYGISKNEQIKSILK